MSILRDEKNKLSAARVFLAVWLANGIGYLWLGHPDNASLAFLSGVALPLICWAAGPRIAQYIAPQIGNVVGAIGQAKILERRKNGETEETP